MIVLLVALQGAVPVADDRALRAAIGAAHDFEEARTQDQFAEPAIDRSVIGRPFRIVAELHDGTVAGATGGAGYYSYEDGVLRLTASVREQSAERGGTRRLIAYFDERRRPGESYVGTNTYGASTRVEVTWVEQDGVALVERPLGRESPYASRYRVPGVRDPLRDYWTEVRLAPAEARLMARNARIVIEGVVAPLEEGLLSECNSNYGGPTIDRPREIFIQTCWVGAAVSRIAILDGRSGSVLQEWTRGTDPESQGGKDGN